MEIRFREFDPFNCWIWLRFSNPPGQGERGYIETTLDSWFFLGKLGGFNAENLQVHEEGAEVSWMGCLLYTSPSPRDRQKSRMPSSA